MSFYNLLLNYSNMCAVAQHRRTIMARLYAYDVSTGGFSYFASEADWKRQMTCAGAKNYVVDHVRTQITREVPVAIDAFKNESAITQIGVGFFAAARMTLSPLTLLLPLSRGPDSIPHALADINEYLGRRS